MNDKTMSIEEMIESLENQGFVVYTKEDMDSKYNEIGNQGDLIIKLCKDKDKLREKLKEMKAKLYATEGNLYVTDRQLDNSRVALQKLHQEKLLKVQGALLDFYSEIKEYKFSIEPKEFDVELSDGTKIHHQTPDVVIGLRNIQEILKDKFNLDVEHR